MHGAERLEGVTIHDAAGATDRYLPAAGLFVFIGAAPRTDWLRGCVAMDDNGFLLTGRDLPIADLAAFANDLPLETETSQPGIFAVGDVRAGSVKRVASAVGEGAMAFRMVHQRLANPTHLPSPSALSSPGPLRGEPGHHTPGIRRARPPQNGRSGSPSLPDRHEVAAQTPQALAWIDARSSVSNRHPRPQHGRRPGAPARRRRREG